jgi:carbon storage regulator
MLVLTRKSGETVHIGHDITVTCLQIRGKVMKIGIDAPSSIRVLRGELCRGDCGAGRLASTVLCDIGHPCG